MNCVFFRMFFLNFEGPKGQTFSSIKNRIDPISTFFLSLLSLFFPNSFLFFVFFCLLKSSILVTFTLNRSVFLYVIWAFAFVLLSILIKKIFSEFQFLKKIDGIYLIS